MIGKGILQSLEAAMAALMILTALAIVFSSKENIPEFETVSWKSKGFNSLKTLDDSNELRLYALTNNTQIIVEKLQNLLPSNVNFDVKICSSNCTLPNITAEKIVSVSYLISGNVTTFNPKEIFLYMW